MSNHNQTFFEAGQDVVADMLATDINGGATGDWVKVANYDRAYLKITKAAGTAGDDIVLAVNQATDNAGTGSKAVTISRVWYRVGAFTAESAWTYAELATPVTSLDLVSVNGVDIGSDDAAAQVVVEVMAESLDADNGFVYCGVTYDGAAIGNATPINSEWVLTGGAYQSNTPTRPLN